MAIVDLRLCRLCKLSIERESIEALRKDSDNTLLARSRTIRGFGDATIMLVKGVVRMGPKVMFIVSSLASAARQTCSAEPFQKSRDCRRQAFIACLETP